MINIVTPDTMRALEDEIMAAGTSEAELIERAAAGIADWLDQNVETPAGSSRSVLAVAGPGNNGVDALVAAAILQERGWEASAHLVARADTSGIEAGGGIVQNLPTVDQVTRATVILDGIFGNSGSTSLPQNAVEALEAIRSVVNEFAPLVVAIDCPTGTNTLTGEVADAIVSAGVTLCISHPKIGMLKAPAIEHLGELIIIDIGIPASDMDPDVNAASIDLATVRERLAPRSATAHKSQVGGLLIVGGAPSYYGAPRLTGESALRSGCGYVGLAVPRSIVGAIASAVPELIFHPTSDADGRSSAITIRKALSEGDRYQALVIGPGLGRDEVASKLLEELLDAPKPEETDEGPGPVFGIPRRLEQAEDSNDTDISDYPLVLDADALNWLSEQDDWPSRLVERKAILTPHIGEMARLVDLDSEKVAEDPWNTARKAAIDWGQYVLLKAPLSCVATPDGDVFVAPRATPELATPGTGDALSGTLGALIAQGHSIVDAGIIALYAGTMAGRVARFRFGTRSVIARDEIASIGQIFRDLDYPSYKHLRLS